MASTKKQSDTSLRIGKRLSSDQNSHWSLRELEIPKETTAGEDPYRHLHPWGGVGWGVLSTHGRGTLPPLHRILKVRGSGLSLLCKLK